MQTLKRGMCKPQEVGRFARLRLLLSTSSCQHVNKHKPAAVTCVVTCRGYSSNPRGQFLTTNALCQKHFKHNHNTFGINLRQESNNTTQHVGLDHNSEGNSADLSERLKHGPSLSHFVQQSHSSAESYQSFNDQIPYISSQVTFSQERKVFMEVYGCQMNVNDTEVAWAVLKENGFQKTEDIKESDVILLMTCSIREGAEQKIWKRLEFLKFLKKKRMSQKSRPPLKIGILGCMAERLKTKLIEREKMVDLICGPDAYRDLPRLLTVTESGQNAVNVLLSLDETYADIMPVRLNQNSPTAFISIMRGCDNMCTYCIVPFTRGRERSRPISSILDEVRALSDQGIKEITLLGQNVNSYRDTSEVTSSYVPSSMSKGFKTVYKPKVGGRRFADLIDLVSQVDPEMRIRYTSPHPKDFPDELLYLMRDRPNVCKQIHLPAQSGSSQVLKYMRRGYTREAYLQLVQHIRSIIPGVYLSSDFIAGFCGETDEDHKLTVDLMRQVRYNYVYCFPYSMRQKTAAFHRLEDNVSQEVKAARHVELTTVFREEAAILNFAQVGQQQLLLMEGESKRSKEEMVGRNDGNIKVIVPRSAIPVEMHSGEMQPLQPGDYVVAQITGATSQTLRATPLYKSNISSFSSVLI